MTKTRPEALPLAAFITLGCKANQYDTAAMRAKLEAAGFATRETTGEGEAERPAEIYVINTCGVTGRSASQCRQMARRARRWNPSARIIATGCVAELDPESLLAAGADQAIGVLDRDRVIAALAGENRDSSGPFFYDAGGGKQGRARAVLKVQDGCDRRCAYCVVGLARGRSRSLPIAEVTAQLRSLAARGFAEVALTGVDLGDYGKDLGASLISLLRELEDAPGMPSRLRLSSLEPFHLAPPLITRLARSKRLCPHLHLPLQSGSQSVLSRMGRDYSLMEIAAALSNAAAAIPGLSIGLDLIAGFPGETETEHRETLAFLRGLPAAYFHVFPFSSRQGTRAAQSRDQVPPGLIKQRARELRELGAQKKREFLSAQRGRVLHVIPESRDGDRLRGTSENYLKISFEGPQTWIGKIVPARVIKVSATQGSGVAVAEGEGPAPGIGPAARAGSGAESGPRR